MGLIGWIILGGLAGWIAKNVTGVGVNKGCFFNIIIGVIGSVLGGLIFSHFGKESVTGFNIWSLFVATVGAIVFLWIANLFGGDSKKK